MRYTFVLLRQDDSIKIELKEMKYICKLVHICIDIIIMYSKNHNLPSS